MFSRRRTSEWLKDARARIRGGEAVLPVVKSAHRLPSNSDLHLFAVYY